MEPETEPQHPSVVVIEQPLTPEHVQDIADNAANAAHNTAQDALETAHETAAHTETVVETVSTHDDRISALENTINDRLSTIESRMDEWHQNLMNQSKSEKNNQSAEVDHQEPETETVDITPELPETMEQKAPEKKGMFLRHPSKKLTPR